MLTRCLYLILFFASIALADGDSRYGSQVSATPQPTLDQRLPPVLPGEVVERGGERMKVWSSSGPVSVGQAPAAPQPGSVGVIIDQREKEKRSDFDRR